MAHTVHSDPLSRCDAWASHTAKDLGAEKLVGFRSGDRNSNGLSARVDGCDAETVVEEDLEMGNMAAAVDETEAVGETKECPSEDTVTMSAISDKSTSTDSYDDKYYERMLQFDDFLNMAEDGNLAECKRLCELGVDINFRRTGRLEPNCAMSTALRSGQYEIIRWLITHPNFQRKWDNELFKNLCKQSPQLVVPYLDRFAVEQSPEAGRNLRRKCDSDFDTNSMSGVSYKHLEEIYGLPEWDVAGTPLALVINSTVACEALSCKVIRYTIKAKWLAFGNTMFRREVFLYRALVVAYSISIVCNQATAPWHGFHGTQQHVVGVCRILAAVLSGVLIVRVERREAIVEGLEYFVSFWNLLGAGTYVGIILTVIYQASGANSEFLQLATGVLHILLWINMFQYLQMNRHFAVLVTMMSHMVSDVAKFIFLYSMFLFGFSGGFYVVLHGSPGYDTFVNALITVLLMLFGQINYDPFKGATGQTWIVANLLLLVYLVSVVIVLLNLLIAMMSTSYGNVWDDTEGQVLLSYAQTIIRMEQSLTKAVREKQFEKLKTNADDFGEKAWIWRIRRSRCREAMRNVCKFSSFTLEKWWHEVGSVVANSIELLFLWLFIGSPQSDKLLDLFACATTDCSTLEDGERWETAPEMTSKDQQTALNTRVDKLTLLVVQQSALMKEQRDFTHLRTDQHEAGETTAIPVATDEILSTRVDQLTTVVEQQTALIKDLSDSVRMIAGLLRAGTEARAEPPPPPTV